MQSDWERRFYHRLLSRSAVRVLGASLVNRTVLMCLMKALVAVNASILKAFMRSTAEAGVNPSHHLFPQQEELEKANYPVTAGKRVLQEAGIAYTDLTSCLLKLNPDDRFVPASRHYSPQGNAVVANCLHKVVNEALASAHEPK